MAHTPGPWIYFKTEEEQHILSLVGRSLVATIPYEGWGPDEEDDWKLIAAAPDLLEACKAVFTEKDEATLVRILKKAIAKAEFRI